MDKEKMFSVNYDQIDKIYVSVNDKNELTKIYVEAKDENGKTYVQAKSSNDMGLAPAEFQHEINRWFSSLAREKGSMLAKDSDYVVAKENVVLFASLDRRIKTQQEQEEYKFEAANSNEATNDEFAADEFASKIPEGIAIANMRTADDETFEDKKFTIDEKSKVNSKKLALTAAIVGLTATIGAGAIGLGLNRNKKDDDVALAGEPEVITEINNSNIYNTVAEVEQKISLEGQDWDYYFANANDSAQKNPMTAINDFVMNFNRSEDWMYEKLTPEMIEALKEANIIVDGDEAIFGFTPEQVFALNLVYGTHTNEEYTTMMNGEYIDVTKVMSSSESLMNQGIRAEIVYLLNSDQTRSGIEEVINFTEDERTQIYNFLDMIQVYKELIKEEKYTEAETKMKDIKEALVKYAHEPDVDVNNAKPWILRTILVYASVESVARQYMDTITLNLYDGQTETYVDKDVKTWLFDELTMRDLVEGYNDCVGEDGLVYQEGFNSVEFLKGFNVSTQRYSIVVSDDGVSIADEFVGGLENKLNGANDFTQKLRTENNATDTFVLNSDANANVSNNSELDELTKDSFDSNEVLGLIDQNLVKENKYPKNLEFFTSIYSKFSKQITAFKDAIAAKLGTGKKGKKNEQVVKKAGRTIYIPGTTYTYTWTETWTEEYVSYRTERQKVSDEEVAKEDAANKKKAVEEASKTKVTDGDTGKDKDTTYQDIYNKAINDKTDGKTDLKTNLDDNDEVKDKDELAQKVEDWAKEDAEQINKEHEEAAKDAKESYVDEDGNSHYISGGDEHIEEEYKNADIVDEDEAAKYNRELQQQNSVNSAPTPAPAPAPAPAEQSNAGSGEYTTVDPTTSDSFAPAYEEEIDNIIQSLAQEAPAQEASEGMSR